MPKKPSDYSKTVMYKIICNDPNITGCYVGHTTCFRKRKTYHKNDCINVNNKNYNYPLYKFIRENGGWENFTMLEIEKYPCNDGNEARLRERYHYETLNANLNGVHPARTKKESDKIYQDKNIDRLNEYRKEYREKNKEKIAEYMKNYRINRKKKDSD